MSHCDRTWNRCSQNHCSCLQGKRGEIHLGGIYLFAFWAGLCGCLFQAGGGNGMALARGPCLLPVGDNSSGSFFSPSLAQLSFPLSQDQPRHSTKPGTHQAQVRTCSQSSAGSWTWQHISFYPLRILLTASAYGEDTWDTQPQSCRSLPQENRDCFSIPGKEALCFLWFTAATTKVPPTQIVQLVLKRESVFVHRWMKTKVLLAGTASNRYGSSCSEPWRDLVQQGKDCSALNYPHPGQSRIETAASVMSNEVKKPDKKVHSNYGVVWNHDNNMPEQWRTEESTGTGYFNNPCFIHNLLSK